MSWEQRPYADPNYGGSGGGGFSDNPLNWSPTIGYFAGIRIRVHITLILFMAFELLAAMSHGAVSWVAQWLLVGWISILLHEFGHCFAARAVGGRADDVLLWPLGGLAFCETPRRPWPEFVCVACGPLVSLALCLIPAAILRFDVNFQFLSGWYSSDNGWLSPYAWLSLFYRVNLVLFLFNLWPMFPMDMGRIVRCALWPKLGYNRASAITGTVGMVVAVPMFMYGLLIPAFLLAGIAVWGYLQSYQLRLIARAGGLPDTDEPDLSAANDWRVPPTTRREGLLQGWKRRRAEARKKAEIEVLQNVEAEVDRILEKVHRQGMHSLSKAEKRTLETATKLQKDSRGPRV